MNRTAIFSELLADLERDGQIDLPGINAIALKTAFANLDPASFNEVLAEVKRYQEAEWDAMEKRHAAMRMVS